MSIRAMVAIWDCHVLTPTEKLIALALADWADEAGNNIYPSLNRVATKTGLSVRGVRLNIRQLEAKGVIELVSKQSLSRTTYTYRIGPGVMRQEVPPPRQEVPPPPAGGAAPPGTRFRRSVIDTAFDPLGDPGGVTPPPKNKIPEAQSRRKENANAPTDSRVIPLDYPPSSDGPPSRVPPGAIRRRMPKVSG